MEQKLKVEYVPIDSIKKYKRNAKLHPQEQIEEIKNSITEFGFRDPIGVWNNEIVEGNGRFEAAKQLGMKDVPIVRLDDLTDEQRRAYCLTHNKLTMNSGFDIELLDMELAEIETIDMGLLGFDEEKEGEEQESGAVSADTSYNYKEQYGVIVLCKDEQEQEAVYNRLAEEGYECKVVAV